MARRLRTPRAARRAYERAQTELVRDLERLAAHVEGGNPARPIPVTSASQVDVRAVASPCPLCGGSVRLEEHGAEVIDGRRLRVARITCSQCGVGRALWFELTPAALH